MKKKIIIISTIILVLVGCTVLAGLYFKTDVFKSNEEMFWKYFGKNTSAVNIFKIDEQLKGKSYYSSTDLKLNIMNQNIYSNSDFDKINNSLISVIRKHDEENKKDETVFEMKSEKSETIFNLNIIKNNDEYAFQSDDIANGYIAVSNSELKQLCKNIGIIENEDEIVNKINFDNYNQIFELTEDEKSYLVSTYGPIIRESIKKENYSKNNALKIEVNNEECIADAYTLNLTEAEYNNLIIKILEKLSQDSKTLNLISIKLKLLNLPEKYTNINHINSMIVQCIERMKQKENTNNEFLKIRVYVKDGKTLKTDITLQEKQMISMEYNNEISYLKLNFENEEQNNEQSIKEIYLLKAEDSTSKQFEFIVSGNTKKFLDIRTDQTSTEEGYNKIIKIDILGQYIIEGTEKNIIGNSENIFDYIEEKKVILNELEPEQSKRLYNSVKNRILKIYEEKFQKTVDNTNES